MQSPMALLRIGLKFVASGEEPPSKNRIYTHIQQFLREE